MNKFKQRLTAFLAGRNFASGLLVAIVIAAVVFVNIIAYTLTSFFGLYFYSPEEDDLSISEASDKLFADARAAGKKVSITFCMDKKELSGHTTGSFVHTTAQEFKARYPEFIEINYVNVYTKLYSDSEGYANGDVFDASLYQKSVDAKTGREHEYKLLGTSVIFEYKAEDENGLIKRNFRVVTDSYTSAGFADFYTLDSSLNMTSYNGEEMFASMIAWVLSDSHGTAYMTTGHGEVADLSLASALVCAGYYVDQIDLKKQNVPDDAELVVISNPKNDFERSSNPTLATEISRLTDYKERGGKFFVAIDPYAKKLPVLESFVADFGISISRTESGSNYMVKDSDNAITTDGFTLVADYSDGSYASAMSARTEQYGGSVIIRDAAALSLTGSAEPILMSSKSAVCQANGETVDGEGGYTIAAVSSVTNEASETSQMFFIPSVYLTATDAMITDGYSNKNFLYSLFGEFYGQGLMPYGCSGIVFNDGMLENLTMGTARIYTALMLAVPVVIAAVGTVVLIRRKNR